jgi:predicted ArsR family transcriptional regulator
VDRLGVFKALGDNTRYAIYLELARSEHPLATAEVAELLDLHPNTVRPHLERMREVGLLAVITDNRGTVGRPQNRYRLANDAPSLGLESSSMRLLARLLAAAAAIGGIDPEAVAEAGRIQGELGAEAAGIDRKTSSARCLSALTDELTAMGFDPAAGEDGAGATIAFTRCPFQELAEAYPDLVCHLHRGMIEGFVAFPEGVRVDAFHTLADRDPCRVELTLR